MAMVQPPPIGIFRGLGAAKPSTDGNYTRVGHYLAVVNCCKIGENRKRQPFAAIEMTIVKVFDNNAGMGHRSGEEVSRFIPAGDFFTRDVKQFLCATAGMPEEAVPEEHAEQAANAVFGPQQPLTGVVVEWKGTQITLKNGQPFTKVRFHRAVKASELQALLTTEELTRFFPNGVFQRMLDAEKNGTAIGGPSAPAQASAPAAGNGTPLPPPPPAAPDAIPANAQRSPDGCYWLDTRINNWVLIPPHLRR